MLADALYRQGHLEEAHQLIPVASKDLAADNVVGQIDRRIPAAKILAGLGRLDEAERVATEGVRLARTTTFTIRRVWMLEAMADVLAAAGRAPEARLFLEEAVADAEAKGAPGLTADARSRLARS
jgi:tetratricopeptide (TPR) repeat protein